MSMIVCIVTGPPFTVQLQILLSLQVLPRLHLYILIRRCIFLPPDVTSAGVVCRCRQCCACPIQDWQSSQFVSELIRIIWSFFMGLKNVTSRRSNLISRRQRRLQKGDSKFRSHNQSTFFVNVGWEYVVTQFPKLVEIRRSAISRRHHTFRASSAGIAVAFTGAGANGFFGAEHIVVFGS